MKARINSTKNDYFSRIHFSYPKYTENLSSHARHQPCTDKKGIHCTGDEFGYIVAWQISDKKNTVRTTDTQS